MGRLSRKQLILIIGFILVLISIPLSLILVKNSQIFKSQASEPKSTKASTATTTSKTATKPKEVPAIPPLDDLRKMLEDASSSGDTSLIPTPTVNLAFGPTLNIKVNVEGRPTNNQTVKAFVGVSAGTVTNKPTYVLTFTIDFPASGVFSGISLAGLNPGSTYTTYIKGSGQIDTASTFVMSPTETLLNSNKALLLLSGDLNEDNMVNSADYTIAKSLYNIKSDSASWNSRADFNLDGIINNIDLSYIVKNMGKTGSSGTWYSTPPQLATPSATPTGSGGSAGGISEPVATRSGGYWLWVP